VIEEPAECDLESRVRVRDVLIVEQGGRGGVTHYTECLAKGLAERGVQVTIATANDHRYPAIRGVRIAPVFAYVRGRTTAARLARRMHLGPALNGVRFLHAVPALWKLARASSVTHVQGWERPSVGLIATLVMRAAGARIVYTAHNTFDRRAYGLDSTRIFPALACQTIVHSEQDLASLSRPANVIPHGHYGAIAARAHPPSPRAARQSLGLPAEDPVVLLFGHLRTDKGLEDLLEASAHTPPWQVLVAGREEGALAENANRLADPALAGRVSVHEGFHDMTAVGRFFAAADLVAVPYRRASQSGVLHLAYGFGRPVVVYPVGGLPEAVVAGQTGWVCEHATPDALAAVLREAAALGRDEMQRRGEESRRWASVQFDWNRIAQQTQAVYELARATGRAGACGGGIGPADRGG
jgi:D-inositol-3-phosphate glycosyltransferase